MAQKTAKIKILSMLRILLLAAFIVTKLDIKKGRCHVIISTTIS